MLKLMGKNIHNFTMKIFVYLNLYDYIDYMIILKWCSIIKYSGKITSKCKIFISIVNVRLSACIVILYSNNQGS